MFCIECGHAILVEEEVEKELRSKEVKDNVKENWQNDQHVEIEEFFIQAPPPPLHSLWDSNLDPSRRRMQSVLFAKSKKPLRNQIEGRSKRKALHGNWREKEILLKASVDHQEEIKQPTRGARKKVPLVISQAKDRVSDIQCSVLNRHQATDEWSAKKEKPRLPQTEHLPLQHIHAHHVGKSRGVSCQYPPQ
ncbi:hypothetical protein DMENIID0001_145020 [Sergentomyia squamirostris]